MTWKNILKDNVKYVDELKPYLTFSNKEEKVIEDIARVFPISSTKYYLNLIDPEDPEDPIRKMVIPSAQEFEVEGDFDTSGEGKNTVMQGLQHKYATTVLLLSTNKCAMYCRHCFRKRLVGVNTNETLCFVKDAAQYIATHKQVNNVIISGGDSFLLDNDLIEQYLEKLSSIDHVDFIRFGTRTPVVFPKRIYSDAVLLSLFERYGKQKQIYVVTQFNHPRELTKEAIKSIKALRDVGVIISNQTVLLKGINDNSKIMAELQNNLVRYGIVPYYIFQCRPVKGVMNQFQVPLKKAIQIVEDAKKLMNGHSKRLKFCMSHITGKIEILGTYQDRVLFKYHQAKLKEDFGKIFFEILDDDATWLD